MAEERKGAAELSGSRPPYGRWERTEDGKVALIGSRCGSCGEVVFPDRRVCPRCLGKALEEVRLEGPATLDGFTIVHQLPAGFTAPLIAGYGKFPGGVRVFAPIDGDPKGLSTGDTLALSAGQTKIGDNGEPIVTYRFRGVGRKATG